MELTTFRLRDGVDETTFVEADAAVQAFAHVQPGLLRRTTAREVGSDVWAVWSLWSSRGAADAAVEAGRTDAAVQAFEAMIAPETVEVRRFESLGG